MLVSWTKCLILHTKEGLYFWLSIVRTDWDCVTDAANEMNLT